MIWLRAIPVVLVAALAPLYAPATWLHGGVYPDLAALVVVYVALTGTPAAAACVGVALGTVVAPWTSEPLGLAPFVLGALGFAIGYARRTFDGDRLAVQAAFVAAAAIVARLAPAAVGTLDGTFVHQVPPALVTALVTMAAAPPLFALMGVVGFVRAPRRRFAHV